MKKTTKALGLFLILSLSIASMSLQSCGSNEKKETKTDTPSASSSDMNGSDKKESSASTDKAATTTEANTSGVSSCAQIAEDYGKFVDDYIDIYQKYKKDPTNTAYLSDYTNYAQKSISLSKELQSNKDCGKDLTYAAEILKHTTRMTKALSQR